MEPYLAGELQPERLAVDLPPGTKLADRFIIKKVLGQGSWGQIFLAEDTLRSIMVALKLAVVMPDQLIEVMSWFRKEIGLFARLSSFKNVIQLFDLHQAPWGGVSLLFVSMEYADGGSFRAWLTRHQEDQQTRARLGLQYFLQACRGVMAVHIAGVVDLGLNPDKLFLSDGQMKVADLGGVHPKEDQGDDRSPARAAALWVRATPTYMSPEHFLASRPGELDARADIYALGVILYELLSQACSPPFTGSDDQLRHCHLNVVPPMLQGVDNRLAKIVARCLAKDPADRFQTVDELIAELDRFQQAGPAAPHNETPEGQQATDKKWAEASRLYGQGRLAQATALLEAILSAEPDHAQAASLREEIHRRSFQAEQLYREAERLSENGQLNETVAVLSSAARLYPEHPSGVAVQTRIAMKAERYAHCMETVVTALRKRRWATAMASLEEALALNCAMPNARELLEAIGRIQEARRAMDAAIMQGDRPRAGQLARLADALVEELIRQLPGLRGEGNDR